ncbi:hypothetical protein TorRG33x02_129310 [Trema orientale]|uniref:Uncharacterized protein n=1 Tax=Trema orientale TaxID=63057 RepID=A0A2P5F0R3_TREOI|nr:hypothetical protein TorRG33x02_129310 [Trema orientale]
MAGGDAESHCVDGEVRDAKALWAAIFALEKKFEAKIDSLAIEIRQALAQSHIGATDERRTIQQRERDEARTPLLDLHDRRHRRQREPEVPSSDDEFLPPRRQQHIESDSEDDAGDWVYGECRYARPNHRFHAQRANNNYRLKIDVPCFDGHRHIEDFLDWL